MIEGEDENNNREGKGKGVIPIIEDGCLLVASPLSKEMWRKN